MWVRRVWRWVRWEVRVVIWEVRDFSRWRRWERVLPSSGASLFPSASESRYLSSLCGGRWGRDEKEVVVVRAVGVGVVVD